MHNYAIALAGLQRNAEAAAVYHRICTLAPAATFALRRLIALSSRSGDRKARAAMLGALAGRVPGGDPARPGQRGDPPQLGRDPVRTRRPERGDRGLRRGGPPRPVERYHPG